MTGDYTQQTPDTRTYLLVACFYAILVMVFCYPVLQGLLITQTDYLNFISPWDAVKSSTLMAPGNPFLQDQSTEFLPFFLEAKRQFTEGMFPLWNPYIFAGNPLWANTQSALLFPLNVFHYFLAAPIGFTISSLLKLFFGCMLTHLYVRKLGLSHGPALLAGVAFGFCSFTVFWLNHPHTNVTPLIPLCFYMVERLLDKADTRNMLLYALVVALTLIAGHVEIAFLTASACGLYYLLRLWQTNQLSLMSLWKFFLVYVYGLLLSAILVFPFVEFLFNTAIWSERGDVVQFSIPTTGLINILLGDFFVLDGWDPKNIGYHAFSVYVGVAVIPLVLLAIFQSFKHIWPLLMVAALSLAIAFTINPFHWLVNKLPLFNHLPLFYFNALAAFVLSVLAAVGLQRLIESRVGHKRLLMLLGVLVLLLIYARFFWSPDSALSQYTLDANLVLAAVKSQITWVALLVLLVWVLMWFANKLPAYLVSGLLVVLVFADLWRLGHAWNPVSEFATAVPRQQPGSLQFLAKQTTPFRTVGYDGILLPSTNMLAQISDVRGYDVPVIDRYHQFFNQALKGKDAFWFYNLPRYDASILPYLNILNARYLLSKKPLTSIPEFIQPVYQDEIHIYENRQAAGHAFLRYEAEYLDSPELAIKRVLALNNELEDVVVIEGSESDHAVGQVKTAETESQINYQVIKANEIELQVSSDRAAWLVLSQSYYPGWYAMINGEETEIFAANYVMQAIKIPAGTHQVVFKYQPLSFTLGWMVSLLSLIVTLWKIRKTK